MLTHDLLPLIRCTLVSDCHKGSSPCEDEEDEGLLGSSLEGWRDMEEKNEEEEKGYGREE